MLSRYVSLAQTTFVRGRGRRRDRWTKEQRWSEADQFIGGAHCRRWWWGNRRKRSVGSRGLMRSGSWCTVWVGERQSEQTCCPKWLNIATNKINSKKVQTNCAIISGGGFQGSSCDCAKNSLPKSSPKEPCTKSCLVHVKSKIWAEHINKNTIRPTSPLANEQQRYSDGYHRWTLWCMAVWHFYILVII